jgi:hypothetical protein
MTTTALRATPGVFRWHPYGCSREPTTLVEFVLEGAPEGTRSTITDPASIATHTSARPGVVASVLTIKHNVAARYSAGTTGYLWVPKTRGD